jgi:hypothetical protein
MEIIQSIFSNDNGMKLNGELENKQIQWSALSAGLYSKTPSGRLKPQAV